MKAIPLIMRDVEEAADLYEAGLTMSTRSIGDIPRELIYGALRSPDSCWWTLWDDDKDVVAGLGGFERLNWLDEIGEPYIALRPDYQGRGLALNFAKFIVREGFNSLNLRRQQATVLSTSPSLKLLEKCGFKQEGIFKSIRKLNTSYVDAIAYALLKES